MNHITLIGRLTKAPVLSRVGEKQTPVCKFTLASDNPSNRDGQANFIEVQVWFQPESHEKYLDRGQQVTVFGHLVQQRWMDNDDQFQERWIIKADNTVWGPKAKGSSQPGAEAGDSVMEAIADARAALGDDAA